MTDSSPSGEISPTMATILDVPISRPTIILLPISLSHVLLQRLYALYSSADEGVCSCLWVAGAVGLVARGSTGGASFQVTANPLS